MIARLWINRTLEVIERTAAKVFTRTAWLAERSALHGLLADIETADVRCPVNGAVFYSGIAPDGTHMRLHAEAGSDGVRSVTLEQTPGGKAFDDLKLYRAGSPVGIEGADRTWARLSRRFAESAGGVVTVWAHQPRPGSVWNTVELPALLRNRKVTRINVMTPTR